MSENQPATPPVAPAEVLLDLAVARKIQLSDRGKTFIISCRRIEPSDWLAYFRSIHIVSEQDASGRITTMDFDTPRTKLAQLVMTDVEGYKFEGFAALTELPGWQERVPLAHRRLVGATLANVRVSAPDPDADFVIRAEGEDVSIDADWTFDPATGMTRFQGLKHIFKTPTDAHYRRYNAAASRSVVTGGSRTGRTVYTGAQETLCDLYDELILKVEGYAVNGISVADQATIRNWMDLHHKFTAAQELFNPASDATTATATATTEAVAE